MLFCIVSMYSPNIQCVCVFRTEKLKSLKTAKFNCCFTITTSYRTNNGNFVSNRKSQSKSKKKKMNIELFGFTDFCRLLRECTTKFVCAEYTQCTTLCLFICRSLECTDTHLRVCLQMFKKSFFFFGH